MDTQLADSGTSRPRGLFITWFTNVADGLDHAVTDEEFAENRSTPAALCGRPVFSGPMELAPGPRCGQCRAAASSAATAALVLSRHLVSADCSWLHSVAARLRDVLTIHSNRWIEENQPRVMPRTAPDLRASSPTVVALSGDHTEPPVAARSRLTVAGDQAGGEIAARAPVSSPALFVSDTVPVTGARPAAQPSHPQSTGPGAVDAGLGGSQTAEVLQPRRVPLADCVPAAGAGQRHTPLPAAASLSAATPDGRDTDHQDASARPRRVLVIHPWTPVEPATSSRAGSTGLLVSERPEGTAPTTPTVPAQR